MKYLKLSILAVGIAVVFSACNVNTKEQSATNFASELSSIEPTYKIILASEVEFTHLNPKRGDLSPKAGTLWGDRKGTEPTGFLLKPSDGFASPPHIHNVSYRGIVISGLIHNDDPNAADMWLPTGSFWTQPQGEVHITAAKGSNVLAYVEIEEGPYLVLSEEKHYDNGERPLNLDQSNMVWVNAKDISWIENAASSAGTKIAFLWGNPNANNLNGTFLSLPPHFSGKIITQDSPFRAVVIKGQIQYHKPTIEQPALLPAGSFFSSEKKSYHSLENTSNEEVIIYIRSKGMYKII